MKQNKTLLGLGVVVTIVVGMITIGSKVRLNKQNGNKQNNAPTIVTMRKVQPKEEKKEGQYTFEDVALHSKPEDC
ncbi:MAG: hypothetical protein QXG00_07110 [Candidatus Woesearchaeota archaeon]